MATLFKDRFAGTRHFLTTYDFGGILIRFSLKNFEGIN